MKKNQWHYLSNELENMVYGISRYNKVVFNQTYEECSSNFVIKRFSVKDKMLSRFIVLLCEPAALDEICD